MSDPTPGLDTAPQPAPACCPWRTAVQLPLLLVAAAGIGFAGQQVWSQRADWQSAMRGVAGSHCSAGTAACPLSEGYGSSELLTAEACPFSTGSAEDAGVVDALTPENVPSTSPAELLTL